MPESKFMKSLSFYHEQKIKKAVKFEHLKRLPHINSITYPASYKSENTSIVFLIL